jgi:hypothetical protein
MFLYCTCHNIRILYILFDGYEGVNFLQQLHFFKSHCRCFVVFEAYTIV